MYEEISKNMFYFISIEKNERILYSVIPKVLIYFFVNQL